MLRERTGSSPKAILLPPATGSTRQAPAITDVLHALLVKREDDLEGCPAGSDEERELAAIERAIGAYEAVRWPAGKVAGGKG